MKPTMKPATEIGIRAALIWGGGFAWPKCLRLALCAVGVTGAMGPAAAQDETLIASVDLPGMERLATQISAAERPAAERMLMPALAPTPVGGPPVAVATVAPFGDAGQEPVDLRPWGETGASRSLAEKLRTRERLGDMRSVARPVLLSDGSANLLAGGAVAEDTHEGGSERPLMGTFNMPYGFGKMSVVSQEVDANGNVEGVNFFTLDRPDSAWDVDVDVNDGAVLELSRKWGAGGGKQPFKASRKGQVALPSASY